MPDAPSSARVAKPLPLEGLLERGTEHRTLVQALNALPEGLGHVVAVVGPPGIGKTAIGAMAQSLARGAGIPVLRARGVELEQPFAFGVVRQLFERLTEAATLEKREELFADAAAGARAVLDPQVARDRTSGGETQFEVLHGLFWFLVHLTDSGPLLAVVDDLHWADAGSVAFIGYAARRVEELPVLLVLIARDAVRGEHEPLLAEFSAEPAATVLRPDPLSEAAVARLVRERLGADTPEALCQACHGVTSGNPLFLSQLLYALDGEGIEASSPAGEAVDAVERVGGRAVKDVVSLRLGTVGRSAVAVAQAVAVLGGRATLPLAAELAGVDEEGAARCADALVRGGFFEPRGGLSFVHPIVRAAIYDQLAPAERQSRHARAASALIGRGAPDEQIASHILSAPDHTGEHWLEALLRAADEARLRGSLDTAAVYLRRALTEPVPVKGRVHLLRMLGLCEGYTDELDQGEARLREALELASDPADVGRCSLTLGRMLNVAGQTAAAAEAFLAGLDRMGEAEPKLALRIQAQLIGTARMSSSLAEVWRTRLPDFRAGRLDGRLVGMATAYASLDAAFTDGDRNEVAALAERALSDVTLSPDQPAFYMSAYALLMCERFEAAHRRLTAALRLARNAAKHVTDPVVYCHRALVARSRGDLAAARADVETGMEVSEASNLARRRLIATYVHCLIEEGTLEEADGVLAADRLEGLIPDAAFCSDVLAARGRLRLAQGDARAALDDLLVCGRRERAWGPRALLVPHYWSSDAALAYAELGEREAALELADEAVAVARELGAPGALGVALRTAGVVRGQADGFDLLEQAVWQLHASESRLELARALFELGCALHVRDARKEARERLRDARALAAECAAPALVAQAEVRLKEGGGRLPRLHVRGVQALTRQERRVAELAADDMTNRQIAQELYLTEKTVETHLSHAYRKLTIKSRAELAIKLKSA